MVAVNGLVQVVTTIGGDLEHEAVLGEALFDVGGSTRFIFNQQDLQTLKRPSGRTQSGVFPNYKKVINASCSCGSLCSKIPLITTHTVFFGPREAVSLADVPMINDEGYDHVQQTVCFHPCRSTVTGFCGLFRRSRRPRSARSSIAGQSAGRGEENALLEPSKAGHGQGRRGRPHAHGALNHG